MNEELEFLISAVLQSIDDTAPESLKDAIGALREYMDNWHPSIIELTAHVAERQIP